MAMTFNPNADISGNKTSRRGRNTAIVPTDMRMAWAAATLSEKPIPVSRIVV